MREATSTDLPAGWVRTTLGQLGSYLNGRAFKKSEWSTSGRPIIRIQDLTGTNDNPNFYEGELADRYVVREGDLLISWSATLGAYIWGGPEGVLNQHIFKVDSHINKRFHYHLVRYSLGVLQRNAHGSGIVHVTKGAFEETPVLVPEDSDQQQAIADTLDRADGARSMALGYIAKARRAIDGFRKAVLASAYRDSALSSHGEPPQLQELLGVPLKNGYSARPAREETAYRVLTLTATTSGRFDPRHFKYTHEEFSPSSPFWVEPGDILVQRGNTAEYVGVPALYDGEPRQFIYPDLMIRVRSRDDIDPRYLWYMLLAPQSRNHLRRRATGSAGNMPKINQKILREMPVPLADVSIRKEVVARIDAAMSAADSLEAKIDVAERRIKRLEDSMLVKAFSGELAMSGDSET